MLLADQQPRVEAVCLDDDRVVGGIVLPFFIFSLVVSFQSTVTMVLEGMMERRLGRRVLEAE